ncbi:putative ABC transporter ATP-binding protein [compost metagenome]
MELEDIRMLVYGKYVRKYWKLFSVAVFILTLEAMADLLLPTLMAQIIDEGVALKQMDVVWKLGGFMLVITALGALAASARNIIATHVSQRFGNELRADLFRKIQSLSFESIDKFERASLITRLTNDVSQVQNMINGLMRIFAKAPLLCIGGIIMAIRLDPHLAIVLVVVVPIVGLLIVINMNTGYPRFMKVQKALDKVNRTIREYLSGVRVVKAFNRFDYEEDKFEQANVEYQASSIHVMRVMTIFNPAIMLTVNLGIIMVIWLGSRWVQEGTMQVGVIVAFINYMIQILFALMLISMVFNMFIRAKASASRIGEVLIQVDPMTWEAGAVDHMREKGSVEFENVSFFYPSLSRAPVLRNVSFTCQPGETVAIIGSTGSGKSSLISLIPRFYEASSGMIKVNGVDVSKLDPQVLRETIAVVPQKSVLFTGTILENIRWGKEAASTEDIESAAKVAEAHPFIEELPEGYDTRLGQRGVNLSGGQKQRISIARALVRKPEILILDDCTSAVDMETEARIKEALKQYASGMTCLLIAQRITSVMDADKIIVLDQGGIVGMGKHEMLMKTCRVYQEIYQSQMGKDVQSDV